MSAIVAVNSPSKVYWFPNSLVLASSLLIKSSILICLGLTFSKILSTILLTPLVLIVGKASIDNSCPKFLVLAKAVKTACRTLLIASILLNLITVVFSKYVISYQTASK